MKIKYLVFIFLLAGSFSACIGGGTHGSIKGYRYFTSKYDLENAIHQVINGSQVIKQDSAKDYYNDDTNYITININEKGLQYSYIFRFYRDKEYWDSSKTSAIFIVYAYDENQKGGSEGNGGFRWYNNKLKKRLTAAFERELVDKIDKVLGIYHFEE